MRYLSRYSRRMSLIREDSDPRKILIGLLWITVIVAGVVVLVVVS